MLQVSVLLASDSTESRGLIDLRRWHSDRLMLVPAVVGACKRDPSTALTWSGHKAVFNEVYFWNSRPGKYALLAPLSDLFPSRSKACSNGSGKLRHRLTGCWANDASAACPFTLKRTHDGMTGQTECGSDRHTVLSSPAASRLRAPTDFGPHCHKRCPVSRSFLRAFPSTR